MPTKITKPLTVNRAPFMRARYKCSDPTLYRWTKSGKIPKPRYMNGQRIWSDEQVAEADKNLITDSPDETVANLA